MLHASGVSLYYNYMDIRAYFWIQEGHTQLLARIYLFLELIQCAFWVQNGKNDGFTKVSVESWKSHIVHGVATLAAAPSPPTSSQIFSHSAQLQQVIKKHFEEWRRASGVRQMS